MADGEANPALTDFIARFKAYFRLSHFPLDIFPAEDDWALVVKSEALIEITLSRILETHFGTPELDDIIARLPTGTRYGKLAFIKALKLLPENACFFVERLTELRGTLVHDARQLQFSLKMYFDGMASSERNNWRKALWWWLEEPPRDKPFGSIRAPTLELMMHAFLRDTQPEDQRDRRIEDSSPESNPT